MNLAITIDQSARLAQVDLEAQFLPAHITGTLHSEEFIFIALALNGTVRAITRPWPFAVKGRYGRWSALLDPQFFQPGKNTIEAFGVTTHNDRVTLVRAVGSPQYLPVFQPQANATLLTSSNETYKTIVTTSRNR